MRRRPVPGTDAHTASQRGVEDQRQCGDHQRADQRDVELAHLDAVDQVAAQTTEAGVRGDGGGGDDLQRRGAQPAEDQRQRVRHLDAHQHPGLGHAHRTCGVDDRAVDVGDSGVGSGQQRRDAQQHQRHRRRDQAQPHSSTPSSSTPSVGSARSALTR